MLGSGRPFLIEVQNSRKCPSQQSLTEIEEKINNSEKKLVRPLNTQVVSVDNVVCLQAYKQYFWLQVGVKDLKFIGSECWAMMREGEAEKQVSFV